MTIAPTLSIANLVPDRVLVAGDWHANVAWARGVVTLLLDLLPDESPRVVVHAGDFGIWRGEFGDNYLQILNNALVRYDALVLFVDGNHEDFALLHEIAGTSDPREPVQIRSNIWWLPRGYRWTWHDRTWLALGGAVSVNRVQLREGFDYFPAEQITKEQSDRVRADGHADVMVCHDCPASVPLRLRQPPQWWSDRDLALSAVHRERLQDIVDDVRPSYLIHGHYDIEHDTVVDMPFGPVTVTGLDRDKATSGNYRVLDVRAMRYISLTDARG
jgi:hypothetical protein